MPSSPQARDVTLEKASGARTFIGLVQQAKNVVAVSEVSDNSPLFGDILPGDILVAVDGKPAVSARDASLKLVESTCLRLRVRTPLESEAVFVEPELLDTLELGRCRKTSLPLVLASRPDSTSPKTTTTRDLEHAHSVRLLHPGDLILAVGGHTVDSVKAVQSCFKEAQSTGAHVLVELRVVRGPETAFHAPVGAVSPDASPSAAPATSYSIARVPWASRTPSPSERATGMSEE